MGDPRAPGRWRFYPDDSVGYEYPASYVKAFGADYRPDDYIEADYRRIKDHKWYMSGRMITVHDIYSFDPNVEVELEEFTDVIGRHFRQPEEGLGYDNSPTAHMWRAMIRTRRSIWFPGGRSRSVLAGSVSWSRRAGIHGAPDGALSGVGPGTEQATWI